MCLLANIHRNSKERSSPFKLEEFRMLGVKRKPVKPQSWQDQLKTLQAYFKTAKKN